MRLHQLKLDFISEQDRLLLRVSTDNQLEVRLWLTRRALRLLWPLLVQMWCAPRPKSRCRATRRRATP